MSDLPILTRDEERQSDDDPYIAELSRASKRRILAVLGSKRT